jgi:hypothetical protein
MRTDIPQPGRAMTFPEWSAAIVDGVRSRLPDARAARKGPSRSSSGTAIAKRSLRTTAALSAARSVPATVRRRCPALSIAIRRFNQSEASA